MPIRWGRAPIVMIFALVSLSGMPDVLHASADVLDEVIALAGTDRHTLATDPLRLRESPTRDRQLPFFRALMAEPLQAVYRSGVLETRFRDAIASPRSAMVSSGMLAGADVARGAVADPLADLDRQLRQAPDPLRAGLALMMQGAGDIHGWDPELPDEHALPPPLRTEIGRVLAAIGQANRFRLRALAGLPENATRELLLRQVVESRLGSFEEPDFRTLVSAVDKDALMAGMVDLVTAVQALDAFLGSVDELPELSWQLATPLGLVLIDTTGAENHHELIDPLLVVDVGGDDTYVFRDRSAGNHISVVLDRGGDDRYVAIGVGTCPAAAVMGYGVLWDTGGDDVYEADRLGQGAALFGAALLVDGGGSDNFDAVGYAQAFALGGAALLISMGGDDRFSALTHAQGSGGPEGAAVLVNVRGNDRYVLGNDPLVVPSPQLPDRNVSMGQGAGWGIRADLSDGRSTTGGVGALFDFDGDDRYVAQVFAQGAGFFEGAGVLVDGGGSDVFEAAWYGMAAAAHRAAGVLISRGDGDDVYRASHSTSIGAAHDRSLAFFIDEGGNDRYRLGGLGIGAAHDNGTAVFVDGAGDDEYGLGGAACDAFGAARMSLWGTIREDQPNVGLFFDLGGSDSYPAKCRAARDDARWRWVREYPDLGLRSESGAGVDGQHPSPFHTRPRTRSADDSAAASERPSGERGDSNAR